MHVLNSFHGELPEEPAERVDGNHHDNTMVLPHIDSDVITHVSAALTGYELGDVDATMVLPSAVLMTAQKQAVPSSTATIPEEAGELLCMIRDELQSNIETMQQSLEQSATAALAGHPYSLEDYRWQVQRLSGASQSLGLAGLDHFLSRVIEATCLLDTAAPSEVIPACEILDRWPSLVMSYLDDINQPAHAKALCDYLLAAEFPLPMNVAAADIVFHELIAPDWSVVASHIPERVTVATEEMVSLHISEDINRALLDSLLQELPSQTQELSTAVQRFVTAHDPDAIQLAQRVAHTLKGAANTVGIRGIADMSHYLEDILIAACETPEIETPLALIIQDAADCLEAMSEALLGVGEAPAQSLEVLQSMLDWINQVDHKQPENSPSVSTPDEEDKVTAEKPDEAGPAVSESNAPLLRVPMTQIDDLLRLSGESKIVGSQLKEGLRRVESQLVGVRRQHQMLQQLVNELEHLVDIRGISAPMVRGGDSEFDALEMDQYGELHTVSRRLAEVAVDSRQWGAAAQGEVDALEELLLSQARHHNEAQSSILKMRMVPAATIVSRLQRAVRQTCRLLDKQVELLISGDDTLIDSDSLNQLIDPLMHLLRNAIDHGIESADQRIEHDKPSQGKLHIHFGREGNQIIVRVKDDGRGLDYQAIQTTAMARGLLHTGAMPSEAQLARMVLQPGFSTRSEVTQISGRGIGLDVVHDRVLKLKGTLDVKSVTAKYCEFIIRLPASLLSAHALLIRNGSHVVAVASRGVRQIVDSRVIKLSMMDHRLMAQIGNEVYETYRIESLLGNTVNRRSDERNSRPALLVEVSSDRIVAILVQAVIDTVDLVVKPLGKFVPQSVGVVGATILGDGSVAPVMDMPELLRESTQLSVDQNIQARAAEPRQLESNHRAPTVLVVDDSLSVRRAMEQLLRDAGYEVRLARDGLEAVTIMQSKRPDIMLVDMEMPRMNGIELATHVRNSAGVSEIPIIMITSRSTEKHRKQATEAGVSMYMTKPYAEDQLLQQIASLVNVA